MASALLSTVIVATLAFLTTTTWANPTSRIIGGANAALAKHSVSLRLDLAYTCGGTIIAPNQILTAAHCCDYDPSRLSVRVGSVNNLGGGKIHNIEKVTIHPEYNGGFTNNIAVLTLSVPVIPSEKIVILEIAKTAADKPPVGASIMVAGWGQQSTTQGDSPSKLQEKTFTVASDAVCHDANENIDDSNICLAHELKSGSCKGDAGNGAVYNGKLVGVCSFIVGTCGSIYPDVFSDVSYYSSWIQEVIA